MYELTVKSTPTERYDGVVKAAVHGTLGGIVGITHEEGGAALSEDPDAHTADNHFGLATGSAKVAQRAAQAIADALNRPAEFYRYGGGELGPITVVRPSSEVAR